MTMNEVIAREEIRSTVDDLMSFGIGDIKENLKKQMELYVEDAHAVMYIASNEVFNITGRGNIAKALADALSGVKAHHIMNGHHQIEIAPDYSTAVDRHMTILTFQTEENGRTYISRNYVYNTEKLIKDHGKWRITDRDSRVTMVEKLGETFDEQRNRFDIQFSI